MNISRHITYSEATDSPTAKRLGIDNTPNEAELAHMKLVAERCFEPLREWYGKPIKINSFFRCDALNTAVGSKPTSYHRWGMAIDMTGGSKEENKKIHEWCAKNLKFTELIWEYGNDIGPDWVHIAYNPVRLTNTLKVIK